MKSRTKTEIKEDKCLNYDQESRIEYLTEMTKTI